MGLDMYLNGEKILRVEWGKRGVKTGETYCLGYWRKHPNLHGYIVQTFAGGVDECQPIGLVKEDLERIIKAVNDRVLPETTGFFFGRSEGTEEERQEDVAIFREAIEWLETAEEGVWRSVVYQASW